MLHDVFKLSRVKGVGGKRKFLKIICSVQRYTGISALNYNFFNFEAGTKGVSAYCRTVLLCDYEVVG